MVNNRLAFVIPSYRGQFLKETLESFAKQTNPNFNIYLGDNSSPDNIKEICDSFYGRLNIFYTRFENHIGSKDLSLQFRRTFDLAKNENWVCIFTDDDLLDSTCVETFYKTIKEDNCRHNVYRFDTRIINDNSQIIRESPENPVYESSEDMALGLLMGERGNSMPDHIFFKSHYYNMGGFVITDYAQSADFATSILLSQANGICTMKGAKINFRLGATNVSGNAFKKRYEKFHGYVQFLNWILDHFEYLKLDEEKREKYCQVLSSLDHNLLGLIKNHYRGISWKNFLELLSYYRRREKNFYKALKKVLFIYSSFKSSMRFLFKISNAKKRVLAK